MRRAVSQMETRSKAMPPLQPHIKQVDVLSRREMLYNEGRSCSNNAWDCLNTPAQFGIIFSVIFIVIAIIWIYWYTVIRPRQERVKESGEDIELDLGDGRTVIVSSGPHQRTVVFRDHRSPTPPPPAYRPPTPGSGFVGPSGSVAATESSQPSPRGPHVQLWPPQVPPQRPQTPQQAPPQSMDAPGFVGGHPVPGPHSQPMPSTMYPPQLMVPGPPPPPPAMMYPRAQPQTYFVIPPPPPPPPQPIPATGMLAQGLIPPPPIPPPPPPPLSHPPSGGFYQQPLGTGSPLRNRPPSPGHASTIEDDDSDRGGSRPPANRQAQSPSRGRSPPPGGSQFTRSRTPSPSERRRQHARRRPRPGPSRSPPRGRQRGRGQRGNQDENTLPQQDGPSTDSPRSSDTSYRSSTSLDSELRTDLASLLVEAGGRQRARETERLQALVDRYDKEEKEERAYRKGNEKYHGGDKLPRLPGQPMRPATHQAETAEAVAGTSAQQQDPRGSHRNEAHDTDNNEGPANPPKRRVAFHEPSLEVLESRVGRPSRPSQSPTRLQTREDFQHGESRVGRRRREPSPNERIVQRPVAPNSSGAESRIGRRQSSAPPREHPDSRRDRHRFPRVGESRVGHHQGRQRRGTYPPETFSPGAGTNYYNTHDGHRTEHPMVDDGFLNVSQSEGPPSSAGATCASRSQASSDSNDPRRRIGQNPSLFSRDRYQRDHDVATPHLRPPSTEESKDDGRKKGGLKSSWGSKLASFLPIIARLATNNPVVREVADDVADAARAQEGREEAAQRQPPGDVRRRSVGHESHHSQRAHPRPRPPQRFPDPRQHDARRPHSQGPRRGASREPRSSNGRYASHHRRPSTIPEEPPRESFQLVLEHAAERLAEGVVESALDRARHHGAGAGSHADVMSGEDDRRRRRPRRSRHTEP